MISMVLGYNNCDIPVINGITVYIIYPSRCLKPPVILHPQRLSPEQAAGLPHNEIAAQVRLEPLECGASILFECSMFRNISYTFRNI